MIISRFDDTLYPKKEITHIRHTVRLFVQDENDLYWFLVIRGKDEFGIRHHYETIGGGMEKGENFHSAIQRELMEEIGYEANEIREMGTIIDRYYLIGRETHSHFFKVRIDSNKKHERHLTDLEKTLFSDLVKIPKEEIATILSLEQCQSKVDYLVHRRDLCAFQYGSELEII